ncbi:hypothetical protein CVT26_010164, partial [Gymnopilus dilepis]
TDSQHAGSILSGCESVNVLYPLVYLSSIIFVFLNQVSLLAEFISVDPITRTIAMDWYPTLTGLNCSALEPLVVDIYVPNVLLDSGSPSYNATLIDQPAMRLNSTVICTNSIRYPSFRTITKLAAFKDVVFLEGSGTAGQSTLQNYPFDVYLAEISIYTLNSKTGIIMAPRVSGSFGIAVNFEITLWQEFVSQSVLEDNLMLYFRIGRSTAIQAFVVIVGLTNWLTAIAFMTILTATLVYQPHKIYAEMFVVPVGALFAFTSIRANLPGAPTGFGATIGTSFYSAVHCCRFSQYQRSIYNPSGARYHVLLQLHTASRNPIQTNMPRGP